MPKEQADIRERSRTGTKEPRQYKVIIFNDDVTTMEFVIKLLKVVFFKQPAEASSLMLFVHTQGQAVVGVYPFDIAKSKVKKSITMAREEGFPLRLIYQPE